MKITALCCTWFRPRPLGELIRCFELQDYEDRELVILDDAGMYEPIEGDRWRVVSVPERYKSLGAKRNAVADLASPDSDAFAIWDDDDLYLPWALSATVAALSRAEWSRPSLVLYRGRPMRTHKTGGLYHGQWGVRREVMKRHRYSDEHSMDEDQEWMRRMEKAGVTQADPVEMGFSPFYIYRWTHGVSISGMGMPGTEAWAMLGRMKCSRKLPLAVRDPVAVNLMRPEIDATIRERPF